MWALGLSAALVATGFRRRDETDFPPGADRGGAKTEADAPERGWIDVLQRVYARQGTGSRNRTRKGRYSSRPPHPVDLVWIALSAPSYGIHGTPEPDKVSKTESHGCTRLTNWDALALAELVRKGMAGRVSRLEVRFFAIDRDLVLSPYLPASTASSPTEPLYLSPDRRGLVIQWLLLRSRPDLEFRYSDVGAGDG